MVAYLLCVPFACTVEETEESDDASTTTSSAAAGGEGGDAGAGGLGGAGGGGGEGGAEPCEAAPCKLTIPQCGCPDGERCHTPSVAPLCWPDGNVGPIEYCNNDCQAGYRCFGVGGDAICRRYCDTDNHCVGPGAKCVFPLFGGTTSVCSENCDAVTGIGCRDKQEGLKCEVGVQSATLNVYSYCTDAGDGVQDEVCSQPAHCAQGYTCIKESSETEQKCRRWCPYPSSSTCEEGGTCVPITPALTIGSVQYGVCISAN